MREEGTRCGRKWVFTTPQFHQSKEVLWGVWSIRKSGLTGTRVWWSHCKSTRTRISKVRNGSVKALKAHGKSTCDRLELKQSSRYHMSPGAARKPWCVKKKRRQSRRGRKEARTSTARAQIKRTKHRKKGMQAADWYGRYRNRLAWSSSCPDPEEAQRQGGREADRVERKGKSGLKDWKE